MAQHELLHGRNFVISIDGEPMALSKSCIVDIQCDTIPISSPSTGDWEDSMPGRNKWEVSCNHLMYNRGASKPIDRMDMVRSVVTLSMDIVYEDTAKFYDFKDDIASISTDYPYVDSSAVIYFDTVRKLFVCLYNNVYYIAWRYSDGSVNRFTNVDSSVIYEKTHEDNAYYKGVRSGTTIELTRRDTTRQGQAIVRQWSGTFTWGNLAQGSFKFLGKGPLSPIDGEEEVSEDDMEE